MTGLPDDAEDLGLAYLHTSTTDHGYGHITLYLRMTELKRNYPLNRVELAQRAQFGTTFDLVERTERSYGWHLTAQDNTQGLDVGNLERAGKAYKRLQKGLDSVERSTGPATMLEALFVRLISISRVKYVYLPRNLDHRGGIPDMDMWVPARDGLSSIYNRIVYLKSEMIKARP